MHPILGDRRRLAIYLLLWQLVGLLLTVGLRGDSAWGLCRAFPLNAGARALNILVVYVVAATVASGLWAVFGWFWAVGIDALISGLGAQELYATNQILLLVIGALLFWLAAACHYLLVAFEASRESERRAIELDLLAREAELRALRAQIDPHFIFNSLHSISALTTSDAAAAREGSTLTITLENPCDPDRRGTRGVGLGLELLRKRLTTQCGAYDAVRAGERDGSFLVEVRMPAVTAV